MRRFGYIDEVNDSIIFGVETLYGTNYVLMSFPLTEYKDAQSDNTIVPDMDSVSIVDSQTALENISFSGITIEDRELIQRSILKLLNRKDIKETKLLGKAQKHLEEFLMTPARLWPKTMDAQEYQEQNDHTRKWIVDLETYSRWQNLCRENSELSYKPEDDQEGSKSKSVVEITVRSKKNDTISQTKQDMLG